MSLKTFFTKQARNPSGLFGRLVMARIFDLGNATLNDFMRATLAPAVDDHILEIGFGTGKLVRDLSQKFRKIRIEGIDLSPTMTAMAMRRNARAIRRGGVSLRQGDFDHVAYDPESFDKVCSTNTIYFWPEPETTMRKIYRLLKPGGKLVLAFEDQKQLADKALDNTVFSIYDEQELVEMLSRNGFSKTVDIHTKVVGSNKFHCIVAVK